MHRIIACIFVCLSCYSQCPPCTNQTSFFSDLLPEDLLPFRVIVEEADFSLPVGLHSFAFATYKGEWLLIAGRSSGLHNVDNTDPSPSSNSFPVAGQNTTVYVINPKTKASYSRSLSDPSSQLTQAHIDLLSVTNSLFYQTQDKKSLYLIGGYGIDNATQTMGTKAALTAIDVPDLIKWVKNPSQGKSALRCMRFAFDPLLQLTGGVMWQSDPHQPYLLAFGQNFGGYYLQTSDGSYSQQIRPLQIFDNGRDVYVQPHKQPEPIDTYRRRDLNVVPIVKKTGRSYSMSYAAFSGVFTPGGDDTPGAWTAPIEIDPNGKSKMLDPNGFSQAMNNYSCANFGLYSQAKDSMYTMLFGGIGAAIMSDGDCATNCQTNLPVFGNVLTVCCNLPFINDITTIEIDKNGIYRQYLMGTKFPIIPVDPPPLVCMGGPFPPVSPRIYWFGANSAFIPNENLPIYPNQVIALDKLGSSPVFVGYIVGGIASTITDTNCTQDSIPSTYIFKVTLVPQ